MVLFRRAFSASSWILNDLRYAFVPRLFAALLAMLPSFSALYGQDRDTLRLDALVQEALANNPRLHAARHMVEAARAQVRQANTLEAPQIGIEFYQTPIRSFPIVTKNSMETDYSIQQMFPWPGKLSRMGAIAENNAAMKEQEARALDNTILRDLKSAYFELYLIQRKVEINLESQRILEKVSEVATKQFEVGTGTQSDILRAQTELTKLSTESIVLREEQALTETMINTLAGRAANEPFPAVAELDLHELSFSYDALNTLASENRPELKALNFNIDMFRSEQALAKRAYYPDIMVRGMYKNMSNTTKDFWSLMIGLNLTVAPWANGRYHAKVLESGQHISHAEMDYQDTKNMIESDIQSAMITLQSSRQQANEIKRHLIPQAESTLSATLASYQSGKTSFTMVLDSYRLLLMAKLDYFMSVMKAAKSEAVLEQAVGLSINEIKERLK